MEKILVFLNEEITPKSIPSDSDKFVDSTSYIMYICTSV